MCHVIFLISYQQKSHLTVCKSRMLQEELQTTLNQEVREAKSCFHGLVFTFGVFKHTALTSNCAHFDMSDECDSLIHLRLEPL